MTYTNGGLAVGPVGSEYAGFTYDDTANIWTSNIPISSDIALTAPAFDGETVQVLGDVDAGGNVSGFALIADDHANIAGITRVGSLISNTSITTNTFFANVANISSGLNFSGNLSINTVTANSFTSGHLTILGNTISSTSGIVIDPAPPGVGGELDIFGNVAVSGFTTVSGNITTNSYFIGDGSLLTNVSGGGGGLGVGQTWQDVASSRALNTNYTNLTGKPIQVSVSVYNPTTTNAVFMVLAVGGVTVSTNQIPGATSGTNIGTLTAIVPNNTTYQLSSLTVGAAIAYWAELR